MGTILNLGIAAVMLAAPQGRTTVDFTLYNGEEAGQAGFSISNWGGGQIKESKDVSIAGQHSLRIQTSNFFQGGLLAWGAPVDLSQYAKVKENMFQVSVYVVSAANPTGGAGGGSETGGAVAGGAGAGGGRGEGGGLIGGGGGGTTQPATAKAMEKLRLVIKTSDGKLSEAIIPLGPQRNEWRRVGVPLDSIPGFAKTNRQVVQIALAGDAPAAFYLGEMRVITDQTPIQGRLSHTELNIGRSTEVLFWAVADAGYSVLEYSWDFDVADGLQNDAYGQAVYHRFRLPTSLTKDIPGREYTVTCTIRDAYGLKQPWTGTIKVTVN